MISIPVIPLAMFVATLFTALRAINYYDRHCVLKMVKRAIEPFDGVVTVPPGWFKNPIAAHAMVNGSRVDIESASGRKTEKFERICFRTENKLRNFQEMTIAKKGLQTTLTTPFGLETHEDFGDEEIDEKLQLSGDRDSLNEFFSAPARVRLVKRMLRLGLSRLVITAEEMTVYTRTIGVRPGRLGRLMKALVELSSGENQVTLSVENRAPESCDEHLHCPYCKDSLEVELEPSVQCEKCQTAHHEECFEEAGGCTVYACRPQRAARQPVKAGMV